MRAELDIQDWAIPVRISCGRLGNIVFYEIQIFCLFIMWERK